MSLPQGPYNSIQEEPEILNWWLENKFYKPEYSPEQGRVLSFEEMMQDKKETWSLVCPPPNAYGRPHIGNISGYAYMDAFARYQRMNGKRVLVLPGKDHAGLEGEGVFVREVLEKKKINKFDLNREEFYQMMMDFNLENMKKAQKDEKEIGLSADFDRDTFTLDEDVVDTVLDTFVEMYQKGMIYKGVRIVNWDPKARTAVADNQIEYKESKTPFFYFKYSFLKPEKEALDLKRNFEGKTIEWKFERDKTKDGKEDLTFAYGSFRIPLPGGEDKGEGSTIEIMGYGYPPLFGEGRGEGEILEGTVIGIQMRLDNKFRLVVVNPEAEISKEDLNKKIAETFLFESEYYAGAHIILFDEYPEDKFYTNGFIIGTVRPETIFADTAIACDPKDERYKEFVEKEVEVEFLGEIKKLNFIEDFKVDKDFGTGLLKVTPAHAAEDWEIAQRHPEECLPPVQVIGYDLRMNHLAGKYAGERAKDVREMMKDDMKNSGNLVWVDENYENKVQIAERTKAPIEPLLSSQWYLKYDGIKEAATLMMLNAHGDESNLEMSKEELEKKIEEFLKPSPMGEGGPLAVGEVSPLGSVTLHPKEMVPKFNYWMQNLRDWAISRSLWWGYRLPVWYHGEVKEEIGEDGMVREMIQLSDQLSVDSSQTEGNILSRQPSAVGHQLEKDGVTLSEVEGWIPLEYDNPNHLRVQKESPGEGWFQDEAVLDTWFSSAQWVYATLEKYNLSEKFFPTQLMISGFDILENWISRMMMFTYFKKRSIPFENVYLTGLVKGTDGQKMSKSKGNLINIDDVRTKYGTDAVRMVYFYQNSAGSSYAMTYDKLDNFKKFVNKLWNASRFVLMNAEGIDFGADHDLYLPEELQLDFSKKIVEHVKKVKQHITKNIENYELGLATFNIYQEFWHEYCDILIEESKQYVLPVWNKETKEVEKEPDAEEKKEVATVMLWALKQYLKMLHPFMPFVTERIWQEMPKSKEAGEHKTLMYTKW